MIMIMDHVPLMRLVASAKDVIVAFGYLYPSAYSCLAARKFKFQEVFRMNEHGKREREKYERYIIR